MDFKPRLTESQTAKPDEAWTEPVGKPSTVRQLIAKTNKKVRRSMSQSPRENAETSSSSSSQLSASLPALTVETDFEVWCEEFEKRCVAGRVPKRDWASLAVQAMDSSMLALVPLESVSEWNLLVEAVRSRSGHPVVRRGWQFFSAVNARQASLDLRFASLHRTAKLYVDAMRTVDPSISPQTAVTLTDMLVVPALLDNLPTGVVPFSLQDPFTSKRAVDILHECKAIEALTKRSHKRRRPEMWMS